MISHITQENVTDGAVDVEHSESVLECAGVANIEESETSINLGAEEVQYENHPHLQENVYDIEAVSHLNACHLIEDINKKQQQIINGCCRDCMKAFSKTGKVSLTTKNNNLELSLPSTEDAAESYAASKRMQVLQLQRMQPDGHQARQAPGNQRHS